MTASGRKYCLESMIEKSNTIYTYNRNNQHINLYILKLLSTIQRSNIRLVYIKLTFIIYSFNDSVQLKRSDLGLVFGQDIPVIPEAARPKVPAYNHSQLKKKDSYIFRSSRSS